MSFKMEEVRRAFPNPTYPDRQPPRFHRITYCVGGAVCLFLARDSRFEPLRFPHVHELATALREANPALGDRADRYADAVICANDQQKFDQAWAALADALSFERAGDETAPEEDNVWEPVPA